MRPTRHQIETPVGPVWLVPDSLPSEAAIALVRLELCATGEGFVAGHTGPGRGGAWLIRAPRAVLESISAPTGSAAELPVREGTVWPPVQEEA